MRLRPAITWHVILTASVLLGCAGKATDSGRAQGAQAGAGDGGAGRGGNVGGGNAGGGNVAGGNAGGRGGEAGVELNLSGGLGGLGSTDRQLLLTSAWDVNVAAQLKDDPNWPPTVLQLTLSVLDDAGAMTGVLSRDGRVSPLVLTRESGARAHLEGGVSGARLVLLGRDPLTGLALNTLTLTAFDDDRDGIADRLVGTGDGALEESCGDCSYSKPVSLMFSGKPDRTPPKLAVPATLNPIDLLTVSASEALKSATLSLSGSNAVPLPADSPPTPVITFSTSAVLPFSGAWTIAGAGEDYAGLPLDLSNATLTTIADPGIFAQDGFETEPKADLSSGCQWVDASSGLPIPNGSRALLLPPGNVATFHLQRTAASSAVSARVLALGNLSSDGAWLKFDAAVIGGQERSEDFSSLEVGTLATSSVDWSRASAPKTVQLALKEAGSEVVVRITAYACNNGPCPIPGALLIDELALE